MTTRELFEILDKQALLTYPDGLRHTVTIRNAREAYGRVDVQVESAGGTKTWVSRDRLEVQG